MDVLNLQQLVQQAPVGICLLDAATLVAETANEKFIEIAGKRSDEIIGRYYWDAFAEVREHYEPALAKVVETGQSFHIEEVELTLLRKGVAENIIVTFTYELLQLPVGSQSKVVVWVTEHTLSVRERQRVATANAELAQSRILLEKTFAQLEANEIALRLAINAANFGTWYIHSVTREFITNARLKELFGFHIDEPISIEQAIAQITDEYRQYVTDKLEAAIYKGGDYDVTYSVIGLHDKKMRWLRAIGNLKADPSGEFSAFTGVVMDVTEQQLQQQRKNDFIGMVSHELKTPLTSLFGYLQLMNGHVENLNDGLMTQGMTKSLKQVRKMTTMIDSFLNIARLESGKSEIEKSPFAINEVLQEIEEEMQLVYNTHHLEFEELPHITINADREKIGQVINNLVSNAAKYSTAGSLIKIGASTATGQLTISVSDKGYGIAEQDLRYIFDRFYRADTTNLVSGFGIGLYLCAEIIRLHNGKIGVTSKKGEGSSFYFTLPLE